MRKKCVPGIPPPPQMSGYKATDALTPSSLQKCITLNIINVLNSINSVLLSVVSHLWNSHLFISICPHAFFLALSLFLCTSTGPAPLYVFELCKDNSVAIQMFSFTMQNKVLCDILKLMLCESCLHFLCVSMQVCCAARC